MNRPGVPEPSSVRSVLVLTKWRFMGDTVVAVPLLAGVRRAFPAARVTLLTGPSAAVILENCPHLDRIIAYDPYKADRGPLALVRQWRAIRRDVHPDLCLVANRSFRSALIALFCGGRVRAGFAWDMRSRLLTHPVPYDGEKREAECDLDVLRAVAPDAPSHPYDPTPRLWLTERERERGAQILAEHEVLGRTLIGIQPGASYPAKQWSAERFAAVADALAEEGAGIVILGGPDEAEAAEAMRRAMRTSPAADLTGATKLRETMGVLPQLSLFVGNDTGINHIANALDVPTVALFGPTPASKWGNPGPASAVLAAPDGDIARLSVEEILAAARNLLPRATPARAALRTAR